MRKSVSGEGMRADGKRHGKKSSQLFLGQIELRNGTIDSFTNLYPQLVGAIRNHQMSSIQLQICHQSFIYTISFTTVHSCMLGSLMHGYMVVYIMSYYNYNNIRGYTLSFQTMDNTLIILQAESSSFQIMKIIPFSFLHLLFYFCLSRFSASRSCFVSAFYFI